MDNVPTTVESSAVGSFLRAVGLVNEVKCCQGGTSPYKNCCCELCMIVQLYCTIALSAVPRCERQGKLSKHVASSEKSIQMKVPAIQMKVPFALETFVSTPFKWSWMGHQSCVCRMATTG